MILSYICSYFTLIMLNISPSFRVLVAFHISVDQFLMLCIFCFISEEACICPYSLRSLSYFASSNNSLWYEWSYNMLSGTAKMVEWWPSPLLKNI